MDITTLAASATATLTLKHPATGEPMPGVTVTLYGPGSREHSAATARRNQRLFDRLATKGGKTAKIDAAEQLREQAEFLAACTADIGGWDYKGATGRDAVQAAYADQSVGWIAEQVGAALGDWATFLPSQPAS